MEKENKICPYCGGEILAVAKKCKHCGKWLTESNVESPSTTGSESQPSASSNEKDTKPAKEETLSNRPSNWGMKIVWLLLCGIVLFVMYSVLSELLIEDVPSLPLLKSQRAVTANFVLATFLCLFISVCVLCFKSKIKRKIVFAPIVATAICVLATIAVTIGMAKYNQDECENIDNLVVEAFTYLLQHDNEPRTAEINDKFFTADFQDLWTKCLKKESSSSVPLFPFNPWLCDEDSLDNKNISIKIQEGAYILSGYIYPDVSLLVTDGKNSTVVKVELKTDERSGEYKICDIEYGKCIAYYHSEDGKTVQEIPNLYTYMTWFHYGRLSYDRYANPNKQTSREPVSADDLVLKEEKYKVKDCINILKMSVSHLRVYLLTNDYISLGEKDMYYNSHIFEGDPDYLIGTYERYNKDNITVYIGKGNNEVQVWTNSESMLKRWHSELKALGYVIDDEESGTGARGQDWLFVKTGEKSVYIWSGGGGFEASSIEIR